MASEKIIYVYLDYIVLIPKIPKSMYKFGINTKRYVLYM